MVASDAQAACDDPKPPCLAVCRVIYHLPPLYDSALCVRVIIAVAPVSFSLASSTWTDIVTIRVDRGWRVAPGRPQTHNRTQWSGDFAVLLVFRPQREDVPLSASSAYNAAFRRSRERHGEKCYIDKRRPRAYTDPLAFLQNRDEHATPTGAPRSQTN